MRWASGILVVLITALPGLSQDAPKKEKKPPDYYPLKAGTKWTYEVDPGNGQKVQVTNQITKIETIDGKELARLETVVNGMVAATEHLESTSKGVFRYRTNGLEVIPPVCVVQYPYKDGETWTAEPKIGPQQLKLSFKSGKEEDISVAAGKYKAVSVNVESDVNGVKINSTTWHAPDVGIVKQLTEVGDKKLQMELVKFEAGK
jgi:hypothetical protein